MQTISITQLPPPCCCYYLNLNKQQQSIFYTHHITHAKRAPTILFCSVQKHPQIHYKPKPQIPTHTNEPLLDEMYSFLHNNNTQQNPNQETQEDTEPTKVTVHRGISSNMGWQNLKARLGQSLNIQGISSALSVMIKDRHLALPHISVKDIRWIDWVELEKKGFRGVVFDKDNTLTVPYSLSLWPPLESSLDSCKSVFGDNVAIFSNSAGLHQYDPDGRKARALEDAIGIHVVRHGMKKPGGSSEDIEKYFGCSASLLIMVGDRHFTDMVYGNRNGFLTILTAPLSLVEEPFIVKQVRKLEASLANYWHRRGLKPISHGLLSEAIQCVKVAPPI